MQRFPRTLQKSMEQQASEDQRLSSSRTHHQAVRLWVMGNLPPPSTTPWALPILWSLIRQKKRIETMLLKSQLRWTVRVSRMGVHSLAKIALCGELSTILTEGHQRNVLKTPSRRPSVPVTLTTTCSWPSGLAPYRLPGGLHLWGLLQSQPQEETPQEEDPGRLSSHTRADL